MSEARQRAFARSIGETGRWDHQWPIVPRLEYPDPIRHADDAVRLRSEQTQMMNDLENLSRLLKTAIERRNGASPYSRDWADTMSQIDELRASLARLAILARADPRLRVPASRIWPG
jgi:hypothetical protein